MSLVFSMTSFIHFISLRFLASSGGKGGGVIQGTASEATLVIFLFFKIQKSQNLGK